MYSKIKKIATLVIASGALVTSLAVSASDAISRNDVSLSSRIDGYLEAELIAGNEDAASDLVKVDTVIPVVVLDESGKLVYSGETVDISGQTTEEQELDIVKLDTMVLDNSEEETTEASDEMEAATSPETDTEEEVVGTGNATEETTEATTEETTEETTEAVSNTPVYLDTTQFQGKAVCTAGTLNIRSEASTNGTIVGKLPYSGICTVQQQGSEWSYIVSGPVQGYVASQYLVFGQDAGNWCEAAGVQKVVTPTVSGLNVRSDASESASILTTVSAGQTFTAVGSTTGWTCIATGSGNGYVKNDYIAYVYNTPVAEAVESTPAAPTDDTTDTTEAPTYQDTTETTTEVTTEVPAPAPGSSLGQQIAAYACQFVGCPYVWGGTSLSNGADCSGFTYALYAAFGISIPRTEQAQACCGSAVPVDVNYLAPGDLCFYANSTSGGGIGHVGVYIGNGTIVHASSPSTGIKYSPWNYKTPLCVRRLV